MTEDIMKLAKTSLRALVPVFGVIDIKGRESLTQPEIDDLLVEADAAKNALKTVKATVEGRIDEIKELVYHLADDRVGEDKNYALYSPAHGLKATREVRESGGGINATVLLEELYAHFGEEPGDKTGKAWELFKRVTDEVEVPRVINEGKLTSELSKAVAVAEGRKKNAGLTIPVSAIQKATIETTKTPSFYVRKMTKDEMKLAQAGELATGATEE